MIDKPIASTCALLVLLAASHAIADYTWHSYGDHYYAITEDYGNWAMCEQEALAAGGHLATVNAAAENAWLSTTFQGYYNQAGYGNMNNSLVWLGFRWDGGEWVWSSGEPVTFSPPWYNNAGGRPHGGVHAYLHTDTHYQPGSWWENTAYDGADPALHVRGIIERWAPPPADPIDPVNPPEHTSQYTFVIGAQPYFQWDGITLGLDFSLSIPTMKPIQYSPSITYPEHPFSPELAPWEVEFGTNSKILGTLLSSAAPIEFNALTLTGTARVSADAEAEAGIYLANEADQANIGASIGAGLNLTLNLKASSDLLNVLPRQLRELLPTDFEFTYPIAGAGPFSTPEIAVSLGGTTFDIEAFRQNLADIDPADEYETKDDVTGGVVILGVPINLRDTNGDGRPDEASVTLGVSASAYAQTSATAGLDFYFREVGQQGSLVQSRSIFEALGHLLNRAVEITDETVVKSNTGEVEIHPDGLVEMVTGSPVWMTTIVQTEELTNLLAFEASFVSEEGAEGILQVFWGEDLVATLDERLSGDGMEEYMFALPDTFDPGAYTLSFRLDSFTDVPSDILIGHITTGYMANVPEPATFGLLALGGLAALLRKRG
jgi:hypothetical protein